MKYIIRFRKRGVICYTSHLDIMKVFKRAFKRAGISLKHSEGFNPHPKMGFAQPLSLGYEALEEYIEFETAENFPVPDDIEEGILRPLQDIMPEGLELTGICEAPWLKKTLAAETVMAEYRVEIPADTSGINAEELGEAYMAQGEIITLKKQKKKPEPVPVDIRPKIQSLRAQSAEGGIILRMRLDQGSQSNLSPELVITTFLEFAGIETDRSEIDVTREKIGFTRDIDKYFQS